MSTKITYKGNEIANITETATKTLKTQGKYCEGDIIVQNTQDGGSEPTLITKSITENGTYNATDDNADGYSSVEVNVAGGDPYEKLVEVCNYEVVNLTNSSITKLPPYILRDCTTITTVNLPNCKALNTSVFEKCINLVTAIFSNELTVIPQNAFYGCKLTNFNFDNIVTINSGAFRDNPIEHIVLGNSLNSISSAGFAGTSSNSNLATKTVRFQSRPNSIANNTFANLPNLSDIYVPWTEGQVANAPWGATSATIHYNYTGD